MVLMRKSLWMMCALVALSYSAAQAMEESGSEQRSTTSSRIKPQNNKNIDEEDKSAFKNAPIEVKTEILRNTVMSAKTETTNFRDIGISLSLVCKGWKEIIRENSKKWICGHFNIEQQNRDVFWRLFKGTLIYKPNPNSEEGRVTLFISSLPNPLKGEFDLSNCGDVGKYLSINTGYRQGEKDENADKIEIWLTPRFLVAKEMPQLDPNHYIRSISENWDAARAPIGIFWTLGGWNAVEHMSYCDYLTTESMEELGSENLLIKYQKSATSQLTWLHIAPEASAQFHISFVN